MLTNKKDGIYIFSLNNNVNDVKTFFYKAQRVKSGSPEVIGSSLIIFFFFFFFGFREIKVEQKKICKPSEYCKC